MKTLSESLRGNMKIPFWWRCNSEMCVMFLIGCSLIITFCEQLTTEQRLYYISFGEIKL